MAPSSTSGGRKPGERAGSVNLPAMSNRPTRFEHYRFLGDKRTQIVYDLDDPATPKDLIDEIVNGNHGIVFGPDTLPEARNRNYRAYKAKATAKA